MSKYAPASYGPSRTRLSHQHFLDRRPSGHGTGAYHASKGGLIALTKDVASAHGREGIRVNRVAPGYVYTPMGSFGGADVRELHRAAGLLGVEGSPWDVAYAVMFFASDESRWITAATLPVDAGTTESTVQETGHGQATWPLRSPACGEPDL